MADQHRDDMTENTEHNDYTETTKDYGADGVIWHAYSPRLMEQIIQLFPKETPVLDLGCGLNNYVNILNYLGYVAAGLDYTNLGSSNFIHADLTEPIEGFDGKFNVISLEVGEHIPEEHSAQYLDNVTRFGGDIIFSWAIPEQEGIGHINCRDNDWVRYQMGSRRYVEVPEKTQQLREAIQPCHCSWFRGTLMYFTPSTENE
jgi:hypothetical protein